MKQKLEQLYQVLIQVPGCDVFYGTNISHEDKINQKPFIVYQELSRRSLVFADNQSFLSSTTIQITLISNDKDVDLEASLEQLLYQNGYTYTLLTEFVSPDGSVTRIYEIKLEV